MGVEPPRPYAKTSPLGGVHLYLTYHPDFVDWLKAHVPLNSRQYNAGEKSWYIGAEWRAEVLAKARASFPTFQVVESEQTFWQAYANASGPYGGQRQQSFTPPPPPPMASSDHAILYVTSSAPKEVVKAAYKALARLYHPDTGGDAQTMQKINAAYERLKAQGKA
jgi:hypothetical protein